MTSLCQSHLLENEHIYEEVDTLCILPLEVLGQLHDHVLKGRVPPGAVLRDPAVRTNSHYATEAHKSDL